MPRRLLLAAVVAVLAAVAVGAVLTVPGAPRTVSSPYRGTWNVRAADVDGCVLLQVRGRLAAQAATSLIGITTWSDVRLEDPSLQATLLPRAAECAGEGAAQRVAARLVQTWRIPALGDRGLVTAATDLGPATGRLSQFNSSGLRIPEGWTGSDLRVQGTFSADVRTATTSQAVSTALAVTLRP